MGSNQFCVWGTTGPTNTPQKGETTGCVDFEDSNPPRASELHLGLPKTWQVEGSGEFFPRQLHSLHDRLHAAPYPLVNGKSTPQFWLKYRCENPKDPKVIWQLRHKKQFGQTNRHLFHHTSPVHNVAWCRSTSNIKLLTLVQTLFVGLVWTHGNHLHHLSWPSDSPGTPYESHRCDPWPCDERGWGFRWAWLTLLPGLSKHFICKENHWIYKVSDAVLTSCNNIPWFWGHKWAYKLKTYLNYPIHGLIHALGSHRIKLPLSSDVHSWQDQTTSL